MGEFKISVIVNTYNGQAYADRMVETLKPCITEDVELLLVDDGSKPEDKTSQIFRTAFPNASITTQENQGLAAARNTGASKAKGEYLQFIDIDDSITPEKLLKQYNFAYTSKADVVYSDWRMIIVDADGQAQPKHWNISGHRENPLESLVEGWWNPFHSYLIKKEAYLAINGSNTALTNAQDFDLMVRLAYAGYTFAYLPGKYSNYYRYEEVKSLARRNKNQYWKDYETAVFDLYDTLGPKERTKALKTAVCHRLFHIARNIYKFDKSWNKRLMARILDIDPKFSPGKESRKFQWLYHTLGYQLSERIANSKYLGR